VDPPADRSLGPDPAGMTRTPRMRDLPAPRRAQGRSAPVMGKVLAWPYRWALSMLLRAGFRPAQITFLSLAVNVVVGWMLVDGQRFTPAMLLIVAGLLDIFDGGVARLRGEVSRWGAFLDSTLDRVADVIVFGCLFWSLAGQGSRAAAALALGAMVASFMVSQLRAEAEAEGLALTEGIVQRLERYMLLLVGLMVPGALLPVLALLAALGILTALQRGRSAWRRLS
jgi:CDP-diacylglycerol--glycerol-3-phosphate 3-phosphatidyltransferase